MMTYKGYSGQVSFDDEAKIFHGEVLDTRDVITFQGRSVDEIEIAFKDSIDDYLDFCKERKGATVVKKKKQEKKCKRCSAPLNGEMVFHPTICLSCVIELDCSEDPKDKKELKKYEKNS